MTVQNDKRLGSRLSFALLLALSCQACSGSDGEGNTGADVDAGSTDTGEDVGESADFECADGSFVVSEDECPVACEGGSYAPTEEECPVACLDGSYAPTSEECPAPVRDRLPFEYTREPVGEEMSQAEVDAFTQRYVRFLHDIDYWRWVRLHSHGMHASNSEGYPHYALWWQDTQAIRTEEGVTFQHYGRADNLTLRTAKVLSNAIAGYLMTGDEDMRWVVEEYSRGLAALGMAMEWEEDDPAPYLQARAVFPANHSFEAVGGRQTTIDYDPVRRNEDAWNAAIVNNPNNPFFGDIWVVNQRSKDDLPHMYRTVPMLRRVIEEAPDESVVEAASLGLEYMEGFAQDVIDSGFMIRTRYEDGEAVVPLTENGIPKDLASFVAFDAVIPHAECTGKLGTTMIALGDSRYFPCGDGRYTNYEDIPLGGHYFNYQIFRFFHIAAIYNALWVGDTMVAAEMMDGLVGRIERAMYEENAPNRAGNEEWDADTAVTLLAAGAAGLPITADEAAHIHGIFNESIDNYSTYEGWDPWREDFPLGNFNYQPTRGASVRTEELAYFFEYCYSPFRNPTSAPLINCEILWDIDNWGNYPL